MVRFARAFLAAFLASASPISASVVYQYQGNHFDTFRGANAVPGMYDSTMSVSGFLELADPLDANLAGVDITPVVLGFSFSDGRNTPITDGDAASLSFVRFGELSTNASGDIVEWDILLARSGDFGLSIQTRNTSSEPLAFAREDFGRVSQDFQLEEGSVLDSPGTWTLVPEASTGSLLAFGLTVLAARRSLRAS